MPPKQVTLGKFFGSDSAIKPAIPQQSKLKFSSKSSQGKDPPIDKHEVKIEENGHADYLEDKELDVTKLEPDEDVDMEDEARKTETRGRTHRPSSQIRKRSTPEDEGVNGVSEEEPPTKRTRLKSTTKAKKPVVNGEQEVMNGSEDKGSRLKSKSQQKARQSVTLDALNVDENVKPSKINRKATPWKAKQTMMQRQADQKNDWDADDEVLSTPSKPSVKSVSIVDAGTAEEVSSEHEEVTESEEEKPEVVAKAREKVQSKLVAQTKDPYPDWKAGESVPYAALCTTFSLIEMTTKRLEISAHCSLFLRQVLRLTPKDLLPTILLMINKLAADYTGIELGIGESFIMKAIGESTGRTLASIKAAQKDIGDLGLVAAHSRSNQPTMFKPRPLTVRGVHEGLLAIATIEGEGSQGRKVAGIKKLLAAADAHLAGKGSDGIDITVNKGGASEAKFIVRTLEGKMRLGLADKTVLVALAHAIVIHEAGQKGNKIPTTEQLAKGESVLKSVYSELPSYEVIVPAMLEHGIINLHESCKLQPGVPLKPMLAKPTKSITEVLDRFEGKNFSCEYKYDGERAQIHFVAHDSPQQYATSVPSAGKTEKGISNIFSRNSEDLSKKYPDILAKLPTWVKDSTKSFVLDCESVAWDVVEKKVLPFQQLMTRKRKDVKVEDVKVKVCVFAFDLLFLNGEPLVNRPFRERRELLHNAFDEVEGEFSFAKFGDTNELDKIQTLLEDSVKASCEGLMVKMLDGIESNYEPSRRSQNWLKVKKDYLSGVGDSLDLVVIGAYYGRGKRTSVYGAFLLACYNPATQAYETVCNIGTGFSDVVLEELHAQLEPLIIERPKPFYAHSHVGKDQPDVWLEAKYVWEVKTADLTVSPRYRAAADQIPGDKGISLRFPRFLKVREDKRAEEATTSKQVAEMYNAQEKSGKSKGPSVDDDFEY